MILPLISIPGLDEQVLEKNGELISLVEHLGLTGPVLLQTATSAPESLDLILQCIETGTPCYLDGIKVDEDETATILLDKGLRVVFFNDISESDDEIREKVLKSLPRSRVGVKSYQNISGIDTLATVEGIQATIDGNGASAAHYLFEVDYTASGSDEDGQVYASLVRAAKSIVKTARKKFGGPVTVHINLSFSDSSAVRSLEVAYISSAATAMQEAVHAVYSPVLIPYTEGDNTGAVVRSSPYGNVGSCIDHIGVYLGCIRTDRPDELYTTVVCDENNHCLGLVYSNDESVRTALFERKGVYWSRSRGGLWRKGESSGMTQELYMVTLDCDADALRFSVIQKGDPAAFCHLMTRTCWGEQTGIPALQTVLQNRLKSAPEGSYTKRLFDDPKLLQKKLLEEVQELVEAEEPDHIAAEAADVMYFMMARVVAGGVTLKDIEKHLNARTLKVTRRPGNAKEWRIQNAEKTLGKELVEK